MQPSTIPPARADDDQRPRQRPARPAMQLRPAAGSRAGGCRRDRGPRGAGRGARGPWRRALADLDNLRKRCARDAERIAAGNAPGRAEWLPVLDNLDRALEHAAGRPGRDRRGGAGGPRPGRRVLAGLGFPRRDDTGERLRPGPPRGGRGHSPAARPRRARSSQVVRPGYGDGERQLRPAPVVVAGRLG